MSLLSFISLSIYAQSQYDYMDDDAVSGGVDRAINIIVILAVIALVIVVLAVIINGINKVKYEFSAQKEIDRQNRIKEGND